MGFLQFEGVGSTLHTSIPICSPLLCRCFLRGPVGPALGLDRAWFLCTNIGNLDYECQFRPLGGELCHLLHVALTLSSIVHHLVQTFLRTCVSFPATDIIDVLSLACLTSRSSLSYTPHTHTPRAWIRHATCTVHIISVRWTVCKYALILSSAWPVGCR